MKLLAILPMLKSDGFIPPPKTHAVIVHVHVLKNDMKNAKAYFREHIKEETTSRKFVDVSILNSLGVALVKTMVFLEKKDREDSVLIVTGKEKRQNVALTGFVKSGLLNFYKQNDIHEANDGTGSFYVSPQFRELCAPESPRQPSTLDIGIRRDAVR